MAQSHTPNDHCVRFAVVVAFHDATLVTGRALPLSRTGLSPAGPRQLRLAHRCLQRALAPPIQLDADAVATIISRAKELLKSGDFASARLFLWRATQAGSADAAMMLGATFDPRTIHEAGALGVPPDVVQARQWYQKAAELGSNEAAQKLARLAQTSQ